MTNCEIYLLGLAGK